MLPPCKTALDEFIWELIPVFDEIPKSIEVICKHYDRRTFWPMTEGIIDNMREVGSCTFPKGVTAVAALEHAVTGGLKHTFDASRQVPNAHTVTTLMALLAVQTTAFGLSDESSLPSPISSKVFQFISANFPTLAGWVRGDTLVEPVLTLRAAFVAVVGAAVQGESSDEQVLQRELHRKGALDIPYVILFRNDYTFTSQYEERTLLQCASIMLRRPNWESRGVPHPVRFANQKYGLLGAARGIRRILSSRLPLHAMVAHRVFDHFFTFADGRHTIPWLEAGIDIGILDNLWRARRQGLHASQRVESNFPKLVLAGLMAISIVIHDRENGERVMELIADHDFLELRSIAFLVNEGALAKTMKPWYMA